MKFYGTPNLSVFEVNKSRKDANNIYKHRKLLFRFDENGEFVTEDTALILKLKRKFKCEESEISEETKLRHCKKCDFTCETQGELLRHYREQHSKGDG